MNADSSNNKRDYIMWGLLILIAVLLFAILTLVVLKFFKEEKGKEVNLKMDLTGKTWVSYGDSITDGGFWQAAIEEAFDLNHVELGISGTCVAGNSWNAFWHEDRIQGIMEAKPDLVSILGGTNDFFSGVPLGTVEEFSKPVAEKDKSTFLGAYSYLVERLREELPSVQIVIVTTPLNFTHFEEESDIAGSIVEDFADASAQVAKHYGLLLSDLREIPYDRESFAADFWDGVHPNLEGCAKISEAVIATLEKAQTK